ncbi:MAG: tRNA uridine(34) 5-carboxymethylaminomethyl modification radical SAM/GNAT enzyme Elp3 [Anaerolineae bacterium]|jgi:elongator complex protein 3|nr:tRNA uridine(34) 5-carboxymethylaminomethyl modification radical SAM/GNAT enzyme Elp3 [Anaerolineae bacterium]MBT3713913.1 tRNA uridine(34) 5-carboxymethylaminomethyl modification radical SAM/GNAT enzyme Elp3 [Anaerolineae bacterium]MBT4310655.1 tRNA uridine(34) 5-carboxymethylaminomethyl modification radical SAM/GNAT enzyme Elp3 [Anaerolineae bacterium]MBT4459532.1 tRNA uridine(34) 5-carboxymethylaminomethyl modification radical SAM/GNAT enzyme Elp3 [Anaerolineae bacterium]MBT4841083.1 tRNA
MRLARLALTDVRAGTDALTALKRYPTKTGYIGKYALVAAYNEMVDKGEMAADAEILARIRMKPVRTLSGVTTVTVLTKHYPCPGKCIFCPDDVRMPKSYLPDEPGAMRGLHHKFDPYEQVASRLEALQAVGHPTDKIELLILGGTWSAYRRDYQEWFVKRCFDALNDINEETEISGMKSGDLPKSQQINESAQHRNVGLVVETRPDEVTLDELAWFRYLGVTKVQMGAQSLDDEILALNKRGHTVGELRRAMALLRAGGFKIVLHWMPNLLGATLESDREDFLHLWDGIAPDELKVYPTQLLENTELHEYWQRGEYKPYTTEELIALLADVKPSIPHYCRANRVIRDIPSPNVVEGNKRTSLRQDVHIEMKKRGTKCNCLRCREVRGSKIEVEKLKLDDLVYQAEDAEEHFISFVTPDDKVAGFLRLSLPDKNAPQTGIADLEGAAIIREVHVYGQSLEVGAEKRGSAQHAGLGTRLMKEAEQISLTRGFRRLAVIAAVGTRGYYLDRGFERGDLYLFKEIK